MKPFGIFLFFIGLTQAFNYTIINALTHTSLNRTKELAADFYRNRIYNPNSPGFIDLYQGSEKVLNCTDSMQFDLVIQAIDQHFHPDNSSCNWDAIFEQPFQGMRFLVFISDGKWCGNMPYIHTNRLQMHKHTIYPIMVGSDYDMFQMYHIYGPCASPGCIYYRDYMTYES